MMTNLLDSTLDSLLVAFFEFLGPYVTQLDYWGEKDVRTIRRSRKLDPINQLFLTLMKLKLDLKYLDLSVRFGISKTLVSRYFTTWVCFLYQHLNEIQWMPSVEQVRATLPKAFHDKYETTFAIMMLVRFLYKCLQICICSRQPGVVISIITLQSF